MNPKLTLLFGFGLLMACSVPPQQGAVIQAKLTVNDGFSTLAAPKTTADVDHYTYKLRDNGTNAVIGTFTSGSTSFTFTGVTGGVYKLTAEAFSSTNDATSVTQGGEQTSSNTVTVNGAGVNYSSGGALAATLDLLSGNGETIKGAVNFTGNVGDVDHYTYEIVRTSDSQVVYTTNSIASALFFNEINGGTYKLRARPYDAGNNPLGSAADSSNTVTIGSSGVTYTSGSQLSVALYPPDSWTTDYANMPTGRQTLAAGVVNNKIYAIGGNGPSAAVEEYNPGTNTWAAKANMPTARSGLAASVVSSKIYAIGGVTLQTVEEFNPATNTWAAKANMPTARYYLAAGVVSDKIYAIGGSNGGNLATVEEYNPSTDAWVAKTSMPTARQLAAAGVVSGKIYVIGGNNGSDLATVEEYNPATDTWAAKASMPTARSQLTASVVNGKIYAIGGWNGAAQAKVEEYDPVANTWATKASSPVTHRFHTEGTVGNLIYVIGGQNDNVKVERYEP